MLRSVMQILKEDRGIGVVLIGLVIIFKEQLTNLVNSIFKTITTRSGTI